MTFQEALEASGFAKTASGYWALQFGDGYEVTLEPLLFDKQHYLAVYKDENLICGTKIPIKPGKE